jgi:D-alanyl-D-alanine carboxypeptidase
VRFKQGVDGLKTGYTKDSGYCLTATMKKNNMRVIAVAMGEPSSATRNTEVGNMLDYAFAQYGIQKLLSKDSIVDTISLNKSKKEKISVIPIEEINILYKKSDEKLVPTYDIKYNKLKSSIKKGDIIGTISVLNGNKVIRTVNLTVIEEVKKANPLELFIRYSRDIITGNINF